MPARPILVALGSLLVAGCWDLSYELAGSGGSAAATTGSSSATGLSTSGGDPAGAGGAASTVSATTTGGGESASTTGSPGSGGDGGAPAGGGGDGGAPSPTTTGGDQTTADATSTGSDASSTTAATTTVTTGGSLDPNGTPCSSGQTCQSTFCVDGVCCNEACEGPCLTCGGGPFSPGDAGQCTSYEQEDPEDECPDCQVCDLGMCSDPCVTMGQICCMIGQARCEQAQFCQ